MFLNMLNGQVKPPKTHQISKWKYIITRCTPCLGKSEYKPCLRSFAIPLGHLRDLIVYLWDIISCGILVVFCGTLVDFRTCLVVPLSEIACKLPSSLWGLCGISLFAYGIFYPMGFW
jgi:hypothetical protein